MSSGFASSKTFKSVFFIKKTGQINVLSGCPSLCLFQYPLLKKVFKASSIDDLPTPLLPTYIDNYFQFYLRQV
jgi:hypothetical protein